MSHSAVSLIKAWVAGLHIVGPTQSTKKPANGAPEKSAKVAKDQSMRCRSQSGHSVGVFGSALEKHQKH